MLSPQKISEGPLRVDGSSYINGSLLNDAIVNANCFLHIRGNLKGSLTIERGAKVVVDGSVGGKVTNKGGSLVVHNRGISEFLRVDGPPEAEAGGVLKVDLTAIALNWDALAKRVEGSECAAVVKADAYGCGINSVAVALAEAGCKTFFVSDLAEARRVRTAAPVSTIYVCNGLFGNAPIFAAINAQPVINSLVELAEWDAFVASNRWTGGCALNVDTGTTREGLSMEDAAALAPRSQLPGHGITLLMSHLDNAERPDHPPNDRQIDAFQSLRRLYAGIPASLANSFSLFAEPKTHCDLVRPGAALYGINPTPHAANPMLPVVELRARIVQLHNLKPGETIACNIGGWTAKRPSRVAIVAAGYADGYPRLASDSAAQVLVGEQLCPVAGRPSMDLLAIDVTDLATANAARRGEMVTLIGDKISVDDLAAAANLSGAELLCNLGHRFHRIHHAH